ncbi:Piso0_002773 [Millerozyma farinosa CBS 7064]|uniref:Piso0_002773 protein n=1 Tax=Pichia sorbitophila (strain ATCC MYA-4447 / BCRC 22081 / CBS 7064 / NBRC 10061 / NRRL Y-12695) TaxID=559304 RepID=G8YDG9_PICSO|nr:Piso0_002773 [Millerozyma farinosa CBS 7064]
MALLSKVIHHGSEKGSEKQAHGTKGKSNKPMFRLSLTLESPPVIFYGQPHESTGSIISGLLSLQVLEKNEGRGSGGYNEFTPVRSNSSSDTSIYPVNSKGGEQEIVELESVTLSLIQTVKYTKPFLIPSSSVSGCNDCTVKKNELARWDVLTARAAFNSGSHQYPFSYLLPGSLPASCRIGSTQGFSFIKYNLIATAKDSNSSKLTKVNLPLNISRSVLRGPDRNSLRVFPPTEATANAVLPNVVYPKSAFPLELKIDNIVSSNLDRRWRLRKLYWKMLEHVKVKASTCPKHESKLNGIKEAERRSSKHGGQGSQGTGKHINPSNFHHSTIQTSMTLQHPPANISQDIANDTQGIHTENDSSINEDENQNNFGSSARTSVEADRHSTSSAFGNVNSSNNNVLEEFLSPSNSNQEMASLTHLYPANSTASLGETGTPGLDTVNSNTSSRGHNETEEIYLEETRAISHGETKSGWKSDFSGRGIIEMVVEISAYNSSSGLNKHITKKTSDDIDIDEIESGLEHNANVTCDINDPTLGIYVNHTLVVEAVVAEEIIQNHEKRGEKKANPKSTSTNPLSPQSSAGSMQNAAGSSNNPPTSTVGVSTGAARVLRMQFNIKLTERSGLGIAWDDEVPPTYEDIRTLSPPTYAETSNSNTPVSTPSQQINSPSIFMRNNGHILQGIGDTPIMGNISLPSRSQSNISEHLTIDDRIQDLRL